MIRELGVLVDEWVRLKWVVLGMKKDGLKIFGVIAILYDTDVCSSHPKPNLSCVESEIRV